MKLINSNNFLFIVAVLLLIQVTAASADQPWNVTIAATNQLEPVTFGYHSSATDGFDGFDTITDYPQQGKVVMSLDDSFATSIKVNNLEWVLSVGVPTGSTSTLTWDTSNFYLQSGLVISNESDTINMSAQTSLDLAEGAHNFLIKLVDTTAPVVTIDAVKTPTNISSQTITGTFTEIGSGIASITVNGVSATLGATTYSATISLTEGVNAVNVVAIDNATNTGTASSSIILDTTAPIVMIDTGMTATNATPLMFTGTFTETDSGIASITVNGVSASISGNTYSASIPLSEGANAVTIIALDNAGNIGTNSTSASLDATAPIVTIDALTTPTNVSTQTVTGTFTEIGSGIASITVNGVSAPLGATTYSATIPLSEGVNAVNVIAIDNATNTGNASSSIILDTTNPVVTIDAVTTPTNVSTQTITGTFTETGSGIASITVNGVSASVSSTTYSATIPLSEGANEVNVVAIDNATNIGTNSSSILLDTINPAVMIDASMIATNATPLIFTGTFTETGSGIALITVNGVSASISGNTYSASISLLEGANAVNVAAIDNATNIGTNSTTIVLDITAPTVNITKPENNTEIKYFDNIVRGEFFDEYLNSATLTVSSGSNVLTYHLPITDDKFTLRVEFTPDQDNTLELSAIDKAGNSNNETIVVSVHNNTRQEVHTVNDSVPVNIDAINETDTEIEFYSNVNNSDVTFTITAKTNQTLVDELNGSAFATSGEMAVGKIVEINVTGLDATNESEVQHVHVKLYYTLDDLDLDGDGTVEPSELDEDNMFIYWYNESDNWTKLLKDNPDWVIDNGQMKISGDNPGHVWVKVKHLSMFALVSLPEPEPTEDDGDEDTNGGSGSRSSGGGASGELYENIACSETDRQYVTQNSNIIYSFELESNIVQYVNFTCLTSAGQVATKVEILNDTSTLVDNPPSDIVYKNLNIWVGNAGWATERNIGDATIVFTVEKSWITANNIDESSIALYRYSDDTWHKLVTKKIAENANSLQFEAETPGFSPFAVTGKTIGEPEGEGIIEPTVTAEKTPTPTPTDKPGIPGFCLFAGLSVLCIAVQLLRKKE